MKYGGRIGVLGALTAVCGWAHALNVVQLKDLPGGLVGVNASGLSGDGSYVIGSSQGPLGEEAVYWSTENGTPRPLGAGPGSFATSVSDDGTVIAGYSPGGPLGATAFVWRRGSGYRDLDEAYPPTLVTGDGRLVYHAANGVLVRETYEGTKELVLGVLYPGEWVEQGFSSRDGAVITLEVRSNFAMRTIQWQAPRPWTQWAEIANQTLFDLPQGGLVGVGERGRVALRYNWKTHISRIYRGPNDFREPLGVVNGITEDGTTITSNYDGGRLIEVAADGTHYYYSVPYLLSQNGYYLNPNQVLDGSPLLSADGTMLMTAGRANGQYTAFLAKIPHPLPRSLKSVGVPNDSMDAICNARQTGIWNVNIGPTQDPSALENQGISYLVSREWPFFYNWPDPYAIYNMHDHQYPYPGQDHSPDSNRARAWFEFRGRTVVHSLRVYAGLSDGIDQIEGFAGLPNVSCGTATGILETPGYALEVFNFPSPTVGTLFTAVIRRTDLAYGYEAYRMWPVTSPAPPLAEVDAFSIESGIALDRGRGFLDAGILDNDKDCYDVVATLINPPTQAANFEFRPDGSFHYVSKLAFSGTDHFTYKLSNAFGESEIADVAITCLPWVRSLSLTPSDAVAGSKITAKVVLGGRAPAGGLTVQMRQTGATAILPEADQDLVIPDGGTNATTTIRVPADYTQADQQQDVNAAVVGSAAPPVVAKVLVKRSDLGQISLPTSVVGGFATQGAATLTGAAPTAGLTVNLTTSTAKLTGPSSVTIAGGTKTKVFTLSTKVVGSATPATITLTSPYGTTKTTTMNLLPGGLLSLAIQPTTVAVGQDAQGTVTLSGPAPSGGLVVTLTSSSPSTVQVPPTVAVGSGETQAVFSVHQTVSGASTVSIKAKLGQITKTQSVSTQ